MISEKILLLCKSFDGFGGPCVANISLTSALLEVLEQIYDEYVKTDFYIIFLYKKGRLKSLKDNIF